MKTAITGTICSGKSQAMKCFEQLGAKTLHIDQLAYRLYDPYNPENAGLLVKDGLYKAIIEHFGDEVDDNGKIDNPKLRDITLSDPEHLKTISEICNHYLRIELSHILEDGHYVEAPMLFEYRWEDMFDRIIVIAASDDVRLQRFMARNNITREYAERWISYQMPQDEKIQRADITIWNDKRIPDGKEFTSYDPLFAKCKEISL